MFLDKRFFRLDVLTWLYKCVNREPTAMAGHRRGYLSKDPDDTVAVFIFMLICLNSEQAWLN